MLQSLSSSFVCGGVVLPLQQTFPRKFYHQKVTKKEEAFRESRVLRPSFPAPRLSTRPSLGSCQYTKCFMGKNRRWFFENRFIPIIFIIDLPQHNNGAASSAITFPLHHTSIVLAWIAPFQPCQSKSQFSHPFGHSLCKRTGHNQQKKCDRTRYEQLTKYNIEY